MMSNPFVATVNGNLQNHKLQFVSGGFTNCTDVTSSVLRPPHQVRTSRTYSRTRRSSGGEGARKYTVSNIMHWDSSYSRKRETAEWRPLVGKLEIC